MQRARFSPRRMRHGTVQSLIYAGIVAQQAVRVPMHIPGHRGLIWVSLLVASRLFSGQRWSGTRAGLLTGAVVGLLQLSPHGLAGVLPYPLMGIVIDLVLVALPRAAENAAALTVVGGAGYLLTFSARYFEGQGFIVYSTLNPAATYLMVGLAAGLVGWLAGQALLAIDRTMQEASS